MPDRFYRRLLLGSDLFTEIDAAIWGSEEPGLFTVTAKLRGKGADAERHAIEAINGELESLREIEVDGHDLQRCVNRLESNRTFSLLNYLSVAQTLAHAEMHGEDPDRFMEPYHTVTTASLRQTACEIFNPSRALTLVYRQK